MSNHRIATDPEHIARALELRERIYTPDVEHPCDDHATWKDVQCVLTADRRSAFCDYLESLAAAAH
jgi:hypothetical protein